MVHLRELEHLDLLHFQGRNDWNSAIDDVMSLQNINRIHLISVKLTDENVQRFEEGKGRSHINR